MDQDPPMWTKKEETDEVKTELHSMANKIFQYSVLTTRGNICPVRARHWEDGCKQGAGRWWPSGSGATVWNRATATVAGSDLPIQHEEGVNKEFLEDTLKTEGPSVSVKQDPELKQHADGSEHNVETATRYRYDSARLTQSTGGSCGILCEETYHHGLFQDKLVIDMKTSTHELGPNTEDVIIDKECSVATRYDCSTMKTEFHVYSCNFCRQSFSSKYRLIMHVFVHIDGTQPPLYVCKWCGEVFQSNVCLKNHLRMSENSVLPAGNHEKYGSSDHHQSSIFLDSEPEVSVTEHNEQSSYKETSKASKKSSNDRRYTHVRNEMEKSNDYGASSTAVNVTAQADLLTANRTHKCDICGKLFARSCDLKRHALIHTGKRPHKCDICGKSFAQLCHLKTHTLIHTGEKPHKCEICGKSFTMLGDLKKHTLIHTGKKPHKCEICGKCFTMLGDLKKHTFFHTGEKPHKCEVCGKAFAMSGNLKKHTLIHTGKKPHKCEICAKSFAMSDTLNRHVLIHTGKKPHKCVICDRSFTQLGTLKTHALLHLRMKQVGVSLSKQVSLVGALKACEIMDVAGRQ
ncbi:zinc finger protein 492-like isoform X2 [Schistocerca nitens]|uniref:zinc finger protein 492-like isoform X2 n=1 Tax=Schistocerca nitens TaxID=7011 RepID=UPI0021182522|nr:zinc finger protein 492-like isoform X2 [Schistocerca nitens]